jgi:sugar phosphate isomerase/epimerase
MDAKPVKMNQIQKSTCWIAIIFMIFNSISLYAQSDSGVMHKGKSHVKISLNAYSFNKPLMNNKVNGHGGMSLFELIDWSAAQGFDAVDITGYYFPGYPAVPTDEFINRVKRHAFLQGLDISGTGVRNDFTNPDPAKRAADVKLVKAWIDVAAKLGAPVIRIFSGPVPAGYENRRDEVTRYMAASIKECAAYAAQRGILIGIQNHGDFIKTADEVIKLVKMVNSDWFGVVVDSGFFLYADVEKAMPYAVNFQLKESFSGPTGLIKMDVVKIMNIVKRSGYKGYLPIETLEPPGANKSVEVGKGAKPPYDPYKTIPVFLQEVQAARHLVFNNPF